MSHASFPFPSLAPFVLGAPVKLEETRTLELKEVKGANPVNAIANAADENAVAFLNSEGGTILWGVQDFGRVVVGVALPPGESDRLRQAILAKLHGIQPEIDPTRFRLEIHRIQNAPAGSDLVVVELVVPRVDHTDPFYTSGGEVFVRLDGAKKKLTGPQLTAWIKHRTPPAVGPAGLVRDPKLASLVQRVRRIFEAHGLEPTHWARFFAVRNAPFTIALTDLHTDAALLAWLDESKLAWIAETFLLRREWIDGESSEIQQRFYFHKRPDLFFQEVSRHLDALIWEETLDNPSAYFVRWGHGKEWETSGDSRIFVIVRIPVVRLSENLYIYKYVSDLEPYPWDQPSTNIQLRAWTRLLFVNKTVQCFGCDISYEAGNHLFNNDIFLHEAVASRAIIRTHIWDPEAHALFPNESVLATATDTLPAVMAFLREHNLPSEPTNLERKRGKA